MPPDIGSHIDPSLRRRIRIFLALGALMFLLVIWDIAHGAMSIPVALIGIALGTVVGFFSSRIYHLSWDKDGKHVVGRIDTVGWIVLALYIAFELARSTAFSTVFVTGYSATAVTFTFISAALIARVFGLRGRIVAILKEEKIFGRRA